MNARDILSKTSRFNLSKIGGHLRRNPTAHLMGKWSPRAQVSDSATLIGVAHKGYRQNVRNDVIEGWLKGKEVA
jgi:hypothetical protein